MIRFRDEPLHVSKMPGEGVKARKTKASESNGGNRDPHIDHTSVRKDGEQMLHTNVMSEKSLKWAVDVKTGVSLLSLTGCFLLAW